MDDDINETVKVWAFFDDTPKRGSFINPIAMQWNRRFIKFEKLVFVSTRRAGQVRFVNLTCSSEGATFELEYNTDSGCWKVKKMMSRE